ncbi:MAG TPA: hypothetical protein VNU68_17280 [Verrucomicrobiae bacterium]|nr:hypothetical protein [Verrucomicrobiae bacterium]
MKLKIYLVIAIGLAITTLCLTHLWAAESQSPAPYEYVTIRWGGRDNTHIIRPGGKVEFVAMELRKVIRPDRTDDRAFYMNVVMNGLTKDGYEFAGMTNDEIVMKRAIAR